MLEKKVRQLIRNTYNTANPRIVLNSKPLLTPGVKDPISNLNKSMLIYQNSCCCKASYIGLTTRHLRKNIIEHVPKSVDNFCLSVKKDDILVKVLNASKRSSIAEHMVNNSTCASSYNINIFKIIRCNVKRR